MDAEEHAVGLAIFAEGLRRLGLPQRSAEHTARWLYDSASRQYERAGAPYGRSLAGLLRWFENNDTTPSA